ncbi:MAG: response regulator [Bacteroidetes bacterium]|nr:response regulator [Bacteroidota bacterium]
MKKKLSCILLVDDDEPTNFLNRLTLEDAGCAERVQVAPGGQAALDYLVSADGGKTPLPNLIFLDINMPAMDGWEFLSRYQELQKAQQAEVVVVMLTTSLNPEDEIRARGIPAISGFRCKPLTRDMLDSLMRVYFPDYL